MSEPNQVITEKQQSPRRQFERSTRQSRQNDSGTVEVTPGAAQIITTTKTEVQDKPVEVITQTIKQTTVETTV